MLNSLTVSNKKKVLPANLQRDYPGWFFPPGTPYGRPDAPGGTGQAAAAFLADLAGKDSAKEKQLQAQGERGPFAAEYFAALFRYYSSAVSCFLRCVSGQPYNTLKF